MVARRQYSDADKAAALAALDANAGNVNGTANQLGISESTLRMWANNRGVHPEVANLRELKKKELADKLLDVANKLVDAVPGKIKEANLQQIANSIGIAIEKVQLLTGEATERHEVNDGLTDTERSARIAAILDAARTRRTGQPPTDT